ncbi:MAG: hypothetical protein HY394_00205 [Candidatus Diapherotrites archaeon]|nr:hypothetical protein [Candidatus Diapherotrites archaeon]
MGQSVGRTTRLMGVAAKRLKHTREQLYDAISAGHLEALKVGGSWHVSTQEISRVRGLLNSGLSIADAATRFCISRKSVSKLISCGFVEAQPFGKKLILTPESIKRLEGRVEFTNWFVENYVNSEEFAAGLNLSRERALQVISEYSIPTIQLSELDLLGENRTKHTLFVPRDLFERNKTEWANRARSRPRPKDEIARIDGLLHSYSSELETLSEKKNGAVAEYRKIVFGSVGLTLPELRAAEQTLDARLDALNAEYRALRSDYRSDNSPEFLGALNRKALERNGVEAGLSNVRGKIERGEGVRAARKNISDRERGWAVSLRDSVTAMSRRESYIVGRLSELRVERAAMQATVNSYNASLAKGGRALYANVPNGFVTLEDAFRRTGFSQPTLRGFINQGIIDGGVVVTVGARRFNCVPEHFVQKIENAVSVVRARELTGLGKRSVFSVFSGSCFRVGKKWFVEKAAVDGYIAANPEH